MSKQSIVSKVDSEARGLGVTDKAQLVAIGGGGGCACCSPQAGSASEAPGTMDASSGEGALGASCGPSCVAAGSCVCEAGHGGPESRLDGLVR